MCVNVLVIVQRSTFFKKKELSEFFVLKKVFAHSCKIIVGFRNTVRVHYQCR